MSQQTSARNAGDEPCAGRVPGTTGRTGSRIAQLLIGNGHTVAGLCRRTSEASKLLEMGIQGVAGDIATISEQDLAKAILVSILLDLICSAETDCLRNAPQVVMLRQS